MTGLYKLLLLIFLFLIGGSSFASTLSNVSVLSDGNIGKIVLDTDKSSVYKKVISNNEIQIQLKNTSCLENLKTQYINVPLDTDMSIVQNGKDTFINLSGENIKNYELLYSKDESLIPIKNIKKDSFVGLSVFALLIYLMVYLRRKNNSSCYIAEKHSITNEDIRLKDSQINTMCTLRNKSNIASNASIHGKLVSNFSNNSCVTIPNELKNLNVKYIDFNKELKNAANS
ncbi:hypothetical protein IJG14_09040 [bacterium]|nr:hypothetical protein [bacterium]